MSDPPDAGTSNSDDAQPGSSGSARGGFYSNFRANKNTNTAIETPSKPSFMDHSTLSSTPAPVIPDSKSTESMLNSTARLSNASFRSAAKSSSTPVFPVASFGTLKRKRPAEVVEKPTGFKVSEFVNKEMVTPRLPSFGTSLTKAKFDFTSNRSMFYSGTTKFGGSSSLREESAKRIKISPVSKNVRTNLTKVSAVKPYTNDHKTLSSKTAESILKTLNKIALPKSSEQQQQREQSRHTEYMPNFSTLSKRLREKRKQEVSLPQPPIQRLNKIESVQVRRPPIEIKTKEPTPPPPPATTTTTTTETNEVVPIVPPAVESAPVVVESTEVVTRPAGKDGLKMKRQRSTQHYTAASDKVEEPVNTMPEVQAIEPMIITAMPKFDMTVTPATKPPVSSSKPSVIPMEPLTPAVKSIPEVATKAEKPPAPIFTPIMKPAKTKHTSGGETSTGTGFQFSSPKLISDKNIECSSMDMSYSFISPVAVVNSDTSFIASAKKPTIETATVKPCVLTPVKEVEVDKIPAEKPQASAAPFAFKFSKSTESKAEPDSSDSSLAAPPKPSFIFGLPSAAATATVEPSLSTGAVVESASFKFSTPPTAVASSGLSLGKTSDSTKPESEVKQPVPAFSLGTPVVAKAKELVEDGSSAEPVTKPVVAVAVSKPNPFAKFSKPSDGSWDCAICDVPNKSDCTACVACNTPKPGADKAPDTVQVPAFTFGTSDKPASTGGFSFGPASTATTGFSFGKPTSEKTDGFSFGKKSEESPKKANAGSSVFDRLKPPEGSWSCPTCMVDNGPEISKCAACEEPKPGSEPAPADRPAFGATTQGSSSFTFGTTAKPAEQVSFQSAAATANPFMKKAETGGWECPTCMITNKEDCLKCVACTEQKPGTQASDTAETNPGFSFGTSEGAKPAFSFGTKETKSEFSFGTKTDSKPAFTFGVKDETKAPPTFSFGAKEETKAPTFSFGAKEEPIGSDTSIVSNPLTNGSSSSFSFVPPPAPASNESSGSSFSFVPSVPSLQSAPSSDFSFGKPATTSSLGFSFGSTSTTSVSSGFSFGAPNTTNGPSESKSLPSIFGSSVPPNQTNGPATEKAAVPGSFSFGASASKPDKGAGFSFGALNNAASASDSNIFAGAPTFDASKFNGTPASAAPTPAAPQFNFNSGSSNGPSFMFNSTDSKPAASIAPPSNFSTTPNFNFGAPTSATAVFGNPTTTGGFNFANNNNNVDKTDNTNIFSQPPAAGTSLFTIGGGGGSSTNPPANSVSASGRKIKRAHRKLGGTRR